MDKVSIIVPVYNAEKYLSHCIESLSNQTYKNIEIILVNDGSTDDSLKICEKYAEKDNRIRLHNIKNSGVSTARNIGIGIATGTYITFVDSDDWAEPNMLEFAVTKIKETESDIVIWSCFKNYYNNELRISMIPGGDKVFEGSKDILYLKSIHAMYGEEKITDSVSTGSVWCKLYRKEIITRNNLKFNTYLTRAQDTVFSINAFKYANKISYFDKNLYHYRINNSSTTSGTRYIPDTEKPFNLLLDEFEVFIKKHIKNESRDYYRALNARTIQVLKWHLDHNFFHANYSGRIWNRRKAINDLISEEPYKTALIKVDYNILPKKEKVMTILFKSKMILVFYYIYKLQNKFEMKRNRKYN